MISLAISTIGCVLTVFAVVSLFAAYLTCRLASTVCSVVAVFLAMVAAKGLWNVRVHRQLQVARSDLFRQCMKVKSQYECVSLCLYSVSESMDPLNVRDALVRPFLLEEVIVHSPKVRTSDHPFSHVKGSVRLRSCSYVEYSSVSS